MKREVLLLDKKRDVVETLEEATFMVIMDYDAEGQLVHESWIILAEPEEDAEPAEASEKEE